MPSGEILECRLYLHRNRSAQRYVGTTALCKSQRETGSAHSCARSMSGLPSRRVTPGWRFELEKRRAHGWKFRRVEYL